jgi:hypothetical protein
MKQSFIPFTPLTCLLNRPKWMAWLSWVLLLLGGENVLAESIAAPAGDKPAASLASVLNPDGSLRPGTQGSFDARHFRMFTASNGKPLFRPASTAGAGDVAWQPGFGMAGPGNEVYTVVRAGAAIYIGGAFETAGNVVARNVARWDGTSWSSLGNGIANGVNGPVQALLVVGTDLYVGGRFDQAGGAAARSVAKWSGTGWSSLGAGISNGNGQLARVQALARIGTDLYVGGNFFQAGNASANSIAKWDGATWSALGAGFNNGVSGLIPSVQALAASGTDLYVAGSFDRAGGLTTSRIAKWNGTSWSALGSGIGTTTNGYVTSLLFVGTDLYVGGGFTLAGGVTVDCLAKWNGTSWSRVGGAGFANGQSNGGVTAIAFVGTELYVAGSFQQGSNTVADYLVRWDGTTWRSVGTGLRGGIGAAARALLVVGNDVYVGGKFLSAGGNRADNLARWDGTSWTSVGPNGPGVNGTDGVVFALGVAGNNVYAGGFFQQAGGVAAEGVARWNGTGWTSLYSGGFTGGMQVRTIAVAGTDVYVGGIFFNAGAVAADNVAKWNGTIWSSLGTGASNGVNGYVYALAVIGSDVYVGGAFTQAGGIPANCIAKWNGFVWSPVGTGANNGVSNTASAAVQSLAAIGTDLYVGGQFNRAGGTTASNIARWNGSSWSSVGTGVNGSVLALAVAGNSVYAGGFFSQAGGATANRVALWNGTNWSSLGTGSANGVTGNGYVQALAVVGPDLYVGGFMTQVGGVAIQNVARWNGTSWSSLGTGTNNGVYALAASGSRLYAGGAFTAVGDESQIMHYFGLYDPAMPTAAATGISTTTVGLYPNPASHTVTFSLLPVAAPRSVQLFDTRGRLLRQVPLPGGTAAITMPVDGLSAGTYVLRCGPIVRRLVIP